MKRKLLHLSVILMPLLIAGCLIVNPAVTLTCTDWVFTADYIASTVDNTGSGKQLIHYRITDGDGTVIFFEEWDVTFGDDDTNFIDGTDYHTLPNYNPIIFEILSPAGNDLAQTTVWFRDSGECEGLPYLDYSFTDGRINTRDGAAPIAVYPHIVNDEVGLIIYSADGEILLIVSPQQIANAPENPEANTEIASGNNVALYRLAGGKWQINAPQYNGKTYVMIFSELFAGAEYESFELEFE